MTRDAEIELLSTFIGLPVTGNQLGRHDGSEQRAVRKAEEFLVEKLGHLL
ncbi:MAG TPA: hypothetical protein VG253_00565 [Streptosporangiaceae bacterium]|nr:hypothetical protein [Streptosporangiaceae bacterium]